VIPLFELYKICETARGSCVDRSKWASDRPAFHGQHGRVHTQRPIVTTTTSVAPKGMLLARIARKASRSSASERSSTFLGAAFRDYEKRRARGWQWRKPSARMDFGGSRIDFRQRLVDFDQQYGHRNDVEDTRARSKK